MADGRAGTEHYGSRTGAKTVAISGTVRLEPGTINQPGRRQHQKCLCLRLVSPTIAITPEPRPSLLHR